ncbi:MAG: signal recognition particle-docking protein FtsY [Thermoproteota archaeon]
MFDNIKSAFSAIRNVVSNDKNIDDIVEKFQITLLESDVAFEVADKISQKLRESIQEGESDVDNIILKLKTEILESFPESNSINMVEKINSKSPKPFVIMFIGMNGCGKTTTVAKTTNFLKKHGLSVVLVAGDTHRPGAIEQLLEHSENLDVKIVRQNYGADPAAVSHDGISFAKNHNADVVIIDTAGRIQTSKNLMDELSKISRVVNPDLKIFVGDALTGNDAVSQAKTFLDATDFDGVILTKIDADVKGGSALSIAMVTQKPILYFGTGQEYDDFVEFNSDQFVSKLLNLET